MSDLYPKLRNDTEKLPRDIKICIIRTAFNPTFVDHLANYNRTKLTELGFSNIQEICVPGAFELPAATRHAIIQGKFDLVFAFGVVIRGDTPHFDYVCNEAARGIMNVSLEFAGHTSIIFGLLTCDTVSQANVRLETDFWLSGLNLAVSKRDIDTLS